MKKIVIICFLIILCILIYLSKEKNNKFNINIDVNDNEIGLIFIKTNTSNHILYKKNKTNILIHISGNNDIDNILNKLNENKISYYINFNDNLNKYNIVSKDNKLYIQLFNKNLCIYKNGKLNNCDYVYFINETNYKYNINLAFYTDNINKDFEKNLYNNWVDMYKIKTNEISYATFKIDDYNVVKLPINN